MIAKIEIELVIEKFGDYSITSVNHGEEFVFYGIDAAVVFLSGFLAFLNYSKY